MPLVDNTHYVDSVNYAAVPTWVAATVTAAGDKVRATAPAVGSERVFVCVVAGTTHATTQPTWVTTRGAKTTDNTVTWQECTGLSGTNGDLTNTPTWTQIKNTAIVLGQLIQRDNGASYQICTTAGTAGNGAEPGFSDTAGTTTADNTVTWTSLGAVGNWSGGETPHARVANALATNWAAAGNTVYVENSHAETYSAASITWLGAGTLANPISVICHDGGAYPPAGSNISTGASATTSFGTGSVTLSGNLYIEGINFAITANGGAHFLGTTGCLVQKLKNCTFTFSGAAGANCTFRFGSSVGGGSKTDVENCTFVTNHVNQVIYFYNGHYNIYNTTANFISGTIPTSIFSYFSIGGYTVHINGLDLDQVGSGKTLVNMVNGVCDITLANCKLDASVTKAATPTNAASRIKFINCNSGDIHYDNALYDYYGTMTTEPTIVLSGGASDGTTPIAWKAVTTANAKRKHPFELLPIVIWNDAVGSPITATIQGIWGGGAVPTNAEIWVEYEYQGTSGNPLSTFISDGPDTVLTTPTNQDAGSGTWGGSTTKFALACTFTPQEKGWIVARVRCGKASDTFYIDPKITLT